MHFGNWRNLLVAKKIFATKKRQQVLNYSGEIGLINIKMEKLSQMTNSSSEKTMFLDCLNFLVSYCALYIHIWQGPAIGDFTTYVKLSIGVQNSFQVQNKFPSSK